MWRSGNRNPLIVGGAVATALLLLAIGWAVLIRPAKRFIVEDARFHFRFFKITRGTNHMMFSGDKILARLNRKLLVSGVRPLTRDRIYEIRSGGDATVLGLGYSYDGDSPQSSKLPNELLTAAIIQPEGTVIPLSRKIRSNVATGLGERLSMWLIPESITNFAGCQLRFSRVDDGKNVATLGLYDAD